MMKLLEREHLSSSFSIAQEILRGRFMSLSAGLYDFYDRSNPPSIFGTSRDSLDHPIFFWGVDFPVWDKHNNFAPAKPGKRTEWQIRIVFNHLLVATLIDTRWVFFLCALEIQRQKRICFTDTDCLLLVLSPRDWYTKDIYESARRDFGKKCRHKYPHLAMVKTNFVSLAVRIYTPHAFHIWLLKFSPRILRLEVKEDIWLDKK